MAALDSACGYAALTLMPDDMDVLTAEFKVNLLAPASGHRLVAEGLTRRLDAGARSSASSSLRRWRLDQPKRTPKGCARRGRPKDKRP